MPEAPNLLRHRMPKNLKTIGVAAVCVALVIALLGIVTRVSADQRVSHWTDAEAVPIVSVINLNGAARDQTLILPGDVQAFNNSPIYARVSGYLKAWYVDIGTPVKAGQTLAVIDTPDLDQQLIQGKADLGTALANQHLSQTTATRWAGLLAQDAVSQQDADTKNGDLAAKTALTIAARANVGRLEALEAFKRIVAPFDGVVTTRSTDIGDLITAGVPTSHPLFTVADESRLRIYVRVPESYAANITPGMTASFTVPEYPGRTFMASLAANADAIVPQSGTLLIQLQMDNSDRALKPGDYAQVRFKLPPESGAIQLPATALTFRDSGMSVAVLGPDGRVEIKRVTLGRDLGAIVEISSGLSPSDRVIDNPPDVLQAGDRVQVASASLAAGGGRAAR